MVNRFSQAAVVRNRPWLLRAVVALWCAATISAADTPATIAADIPELDAGAEQDPSAGIVVRLNWSFPSGEITGYELESKLIGPDENGRVGNFYLISLPPGGTVGTCYVPGISPGRTYQFRIRADFNDGGVSPYASTLVTVVPARTGIRPSQ